MPKQRTSPTTVADSAVNEETIHPPYLMLKGKDELNLAEFPLARLGRNDTRAVIEYHGEIRDPRHGVVEQKWTVSGSAKFGLPTEFAERVLVGLIYLTAQDKFQNRKVPFTIYGVLKLLGLTHNQRNYKAVEKALQQLVGVVIYSEGAFFDKDLQKRVTSKQGFHILEEFWLKSFEGDPSVIAEEGVNAYLVWSDQIWKNFKAGYIKQLDLQFYYGLESTIARRLYRFLDKRMYYQDHYEIDIFDMAARIGMKEYPFPSDLARKLKPAFTELQKMGFLETVEVIKVGKFTRVRFGRTQPQQMALWENSDDGSAAESGAAPTRPLSQPLPALLAALLADYKTSEELITTWYEILQELSTSMPSDSHRMIDQTALLAISGEEAFIAVKESYQEWIERQMQRKFLSTLNVSLKTTIKIKKLTFIPVAEW
ncbi:MAG: replication initiator protein A [Caldilineaceae bacterium]|nr:replication initiator protein A [Caldilineaceae bacterium]